MKHSLRLLCLSAACAAFAVRLVSAPAASDKLHERYVAGLALIANTQASAIRMGQTLDLIEDGADTQASRVASMESRLFGVGQSIENLERQNQSLGATTKELLDQKTRIETRFTTLERALNDDRSLLTKSTAAVAALVASAEKSGSYIERSIAEQTTAELKQHAAHLRNLADQLAQSRQRIGLERTLFEGLQPRLTASGADLKTVATELATGTERVAKQRAALTDLRASLARDRTSLASQYDVFGIAVEGFRVTQVDVLRRWLLDGPPAGEMPSLSINDVIEAGLPDMKRKSGAMNEISPNAVSYADASAAGKRLNEEAASALSMGTASNEISAEFTQLSRRTRWSLAMLQRLESFTDESLDEASEWTQSASNWRWELTNMNRSIAELRGTLASLQLEQEMVASTIKLIAKQAGDTTNQVVETARQIATQTTQLSALTAELKRLSAD